ncbi:type I-E CRISPR-associated protein Cse1/CasA [Corynebacterium kozikiae]|uniref:type I-E CRISPR-associated protein Cse1/CasA n=1 Tax=Corynebacterium kozikiae TaxID=2968469 RepID=UPI00211C482A|nr:type I-E CRISPR-associated protein Cse1/CasA [Corynebacterium sp. 76QC2CO]MCQ9342967.1 type I-E CRISPR-associated protein Cse1/CasA [Corynebacterium sp. 76QC2CO]
MAYSLLDEQWILCADKNGSTVKVSLREVFDGSLDLAAVRGESPAQSYAVLRLLLAIFWRAHRIDPTAIQGTFSFSQWFETMHHSISRNERDQKVLDYLTTYEDRFDLLHETMPFMQVASLQSTSGGRKPVSILVPEILEGQFSMRAGEEQEYLHLDEAARWLIYTQAFDVSGIKTGAVGDPRVKGGRGYPIGTGWSGMTGATVVHGQSLTETLLFNTTMQCITTNGDKPFWELPPYTAAERQTLKDEHGQALPSTPQGAADLATWQSRRIRLFGEDTKVTEVIVSIGDAIPNAGANAFGDPMTPYRYSKNKSTKAKDIYYPKPYDAERTVWRSLDALIVGNHDVPADPASKNPIKPAVLQELAEVEALYEELVPPILDVELVSISYGSNASVITTDISARVSLPVSLLAEDAIAPREAIRQISGATAEAGVELGRFARNLQFAAGGSQSETPFPTAVTDGVLAELEPRFNEWLRSLARIDPYDQEALDLLTDKWEKLARAIIESHAKIVLRGAGPKAMVGKIRDPESTKIISAGDYFRLLLLKLDKLFPSTAQPTNERKESNGNE